MPYKSEAQRRYMHAKLPAIAARWDKEYGGKVVKKMKAKPKPKTKRPQKKKAAKKKMGY